MVILKAWYTYLYVHVLFLQTIKPSLMTFVEQPSLFLQLYCRQILLVCSLLIIECEE